MSTIRGQFKLSDTDQSSVFIDVEEPQDKGDGGFNLIAKIGENVAEVEMPFETALDRVKPFVSTLFKKLQEMAEPASEVEVKFGLKFTADAGVVFAKAGSEVNYEVTLKWQHH